MVGAQLGQITKQTNKQTKRQTKRRPPTTKQQHQNKKKITKKTNEPKSELITAQVFDDDIFACTHQIVFLTTQSEILG